MIAEWGKRCLQYMEWRAARQLSAQKTDSSRGTELGHLVRQDGIDRDRFNRPIASTRQFERAALPQELALICAGVFPR